MQTINYGNYYKLHYGSPIELMNKTVCFLYTPQEPLVLYLAYLAEILLKTAVKLLRLRANRTLDAKLFN